MFTSYSPALLVSRKGTLQSINKQVHLNKRSKSNNIRLNNIITNTTYILQTKQQSQSQQHRVMVWIRMCVTQQTVQTEWAQVGKNKCPNDRSRINTKCLNTQNSSVQDTAVTGREPVSLWSWCNEAQEFFHQKILLGFLWSHMKRSYLQHYAVYVFICLE